jgi:Flp pilus assembly protein TadG
MARFTLLRQERGAAIVEFALVVPILFLIVLGVMQLSRAYQRVNVLTGALREAARYGSTLTDPCSSDPAIRQKAADYASAFGYPLNVAVPEFHVTVAGCPFPTDVRVGVTNYPLFADIPFVGTLETLTITREAVFRWELAP